jgi:uncharacterized protein YidB (DUF937 family)
MRRDAHNQPQSAEQLAKSLPADAWRSVALREGVDKTLHSFPLRRGAGDTKGPTC